MTNHLKPLLPERLTPSEMEVLKLLIEGLSNQEIAKKLYKAERTVSSQLTSVYGKLGLIDDPTINIRVMCFLKVLELDLFPIQYQAKPLCTTCTEIKSILMTN